MLDELIAMLPPTLMDRNTRQISWFTLGAVDGFWQAAYLNQQGEPVNGLYGNGGTPVAAVQDLIAFIRLSDLGNRPALPVNELTGKLEIQSRSSKDANDLR